MNLKKILEEFFRASNLLVLAVLVLFAAALVLGWHWHESREGAHSRYSIVEFRTGEIYFGELHWFPKPHLVKVWTLEHGMNSENQPVTAVNPLVKAAWHPEDVLYFNPAELVAWSPLASDSPFAAAFDDPDSVQNASGGSAAPIPSPAP